MRRIGHAAREDLGVGVDEIELVVAAGRAAELPIVQLPADGPVVHGCGSSSLAAQSVSPAAARQEAIGSVKAW